jgi:hypothetical protein
MAVIYNTRAMEGLHVDTVANQLTNFMEQSPFPRN